LNEQRQQAVVDSQHVDALMDRWACSSTSCTNSNGWCYVLDTVHLKVLAQHLRTWSIAINNASDEHSADVETPPMSLAESLAPCKPGLKNPLRKDINKQPAKEVTQANPLQHPFLPPMPTAFPFYSYSPYSPYQPAPPPPPPYAPQTPAAAPAFASITSTVVNPRSSPILSDGEESIDKLDEYFAWLAKLNPTKAEGLGRCLRTFKEQDIVIGIVDKIKDELFDSWGVSHGIRILVKTHVSKWLNAKAKGRI
jgi:hypothetical protein